MINRVNNKMIQCKDTITFLLLDTWQPYPTISIMHNTYTVNILIDAHTLINAHPRKIGKNQPIFSTFSEKIGTLLNAHPPISKKLDIPFQTFYPLQ